MVVAAAAALPVEGFVVFLPLAVAVAVVSFVLAEAEASFFGPILEGRDLKQKYFTSNPHSKGYCVDEIKTTNRESVVYRSLSAPFPLVEILVKFHLKILITFRLNLFQ